MKIRDFLKKYPRPWDFVETDRGGGGFIVDANNTQLVYLKPFYDWDDGEEGTKEPIFCVTEGKKIDDKKIDERDVLIDILLGDENE